MKTLSRIALAAACGLSLMAQTADQGITRQQADQILQELRQIRQLLEKQQARPAGPQEEAPAKAKITNLGGVSMLTPVDCNDWLKIVAHLRVDRAKGIAPHKPLLVLYALGRWQAGQKDVAFRQAETDLTALLREFGPPRKSDHPEQPFWRLQRDGVSTRL